MALTLIRNMALPQAVTEGLMSAAGIVQQWRHCVAQQLFPHLHGHQAKALADFSYAAVLAGHCQASRLAAHVPTPATAASAQRRFERLLHNPRLRPRLAQRSLARAVLQHWSGCRALLLLDETPKANALRVLSIRLAHAHRALPLAAVCYRPHALPRPLPELVRSLLRQVLGCLPAGLTVVLLADRGLCWPLLVDWCHEHGWHYVLRLQSQTKVRFPDGSEQAAGDLVTRVGQRWLGAAEVFKKAGWRGANVVATWQRGMKEPWLLLTDQRASLRHCRTYGKRMWQEESFRDDKSAGLQWHKSQVNDPTHALRLLLVLALALVLATSQGGVVLKTGRRRVLDPHRRRRLSIVQLGLRWIRYAVEHELHRLLKLGRLYLYPK
jgi:Transposase DDE domain